LLLFIAPEVVNFDPLSLATDMWSVGVIAFILWVAPVAAVSNNWKVCLCTNILRYICHDVTVVKLGLMLQLN